MNTLAESLIKADEGFRRFSYKDTVGKLTIGYGLNLEDYGLPEEVAEFALRFVLNEREESLRLHRPSFLRLSLTRRAVLLSMAYQLGTNGVLGFKRMWAAIERGDFAEAAKEMLDSQWAKQTPARAKRLAGIMESNHV